MSASKSRSEQSTFVVELTPVGRGAVAVVLVDGSVAVHAVDDCFHARSGCKIADTPIDRIVFGHWGGPAGEELVVCRRGEKQIEVHCHGGVAAVRAIIASLVALGCEEISWGEWCLRSTDDLIRAEARIALADATTMRTAAILLDQLNGALTSAIRDAIDAVDADYWPRAGELVSEILGRGELGLHLTTPWRVVLAGPPNVGKSSLINALAGFERAIVSPTPGTTRDVVTLLTAIEGWPILLADTAGLRASDDELEAAGVELAQSMLGTADLVVFVNDVTQPAVTVDNAFLSSARTSRIIEVWNKVDLLSAGAAPSRGDCDAQTLQSSLYTSAATGEGIADLAAAIARLLVPISPAGGEAVPFSARHLESLALARAAIKRQDRASALDALHSVLAVSVHR
jgi:tRNA modification GTPase